MIINNGFGGLFKLFENSYNRFSFVKEFYTKDVINYLSRLFSLEKKRSNVLDLGAGIGQFSFGIANQCKTVYAVEPVKSFIKTGEKIADYYKIDNVVWTNTDSNTICNTIDNDIDLTVFAKSFHWMNDAEVLKQVYAITNNKGGLTIINEIIENEKTNIAELEKIIDFSLAKFLGNVYSKQQKNKQKINKSIINNREKNIELIKSVGFKNVQTKNITMVQTLTIDEAVEQIKFELYLFLTLLNENQCEEFTKILKSELLKTGVANFTKEINLEIITAFK